MIIISHRGVYFCSTLRPGKGDRLPGSKRLLTTTLHVHVGATITDGRGISKRRNIRSTSNLLCWRWIAIHVNTVSVRTGGFVLPEDFTTT